MTLAIFDLDNTLIAGDSDHRWGEFLCATGRADREHFKQQNDAFYRDYQAGALDIHAYLAFALSPIAGRHIDEVAQWQAEFMADWVEPILLPAAFELIEKHRAAGDALLIITATNTAVTRPIAARLGIKSLIGCEAEIIDDHYTGGTVGTPSYREGKVERLEQWLQQRTENREGAWFYSDSHNDLPLLRQVDHPVAVDPDDTLRAEASANGWPIISLRG